MRAGIAGAGILGRLLAFYLVNLGWEVSLFDRGSAENTDNCSMVAAGLITPASEFAQSELVFQLIQQSFRSGWNKIITELQNLSSHDSDAITNIFLNKTGTLLLSHQQDQSELRRFINILNNKIANQIELLELTHSGVIELEPELTKFNDGYFFSSEGHLDNQAIMNSLRLFLLQKINWFENLSVEIEAKKISTSNQVYQFDWVFDCRGLGAKKMFPNLRGVRGELIWVKAPQVNISRPIRLMHPRYSLYVVPRPKNIYLLGASEIESEDNAPISVRTTLELLSAAAYLHPGFLEANIINSYAACRPTLPSHQPQIKYSPGLIAINGLYRHGFGIAPSLIEEVLLFLTQGFSAVKYPQIWEKLD